MISAVSVSSGGINNRKIPQIQKANNNVIQLNAQNPQLLENFLSIVGQQNRAMISFGEANKIKPPNKFVSTFPIENAQTHPWGQNFSVETFRNGLSGYAKWKIETEAAKRINGENEWTVINNINAWMVTAETHKFMLVGGLGQVAADLPNSFNKRFENNNSKNIMKNITPMYLDNNKYQLQEKDGQFFYKYGRDNTTNTDLKTKVHPLGSINVPIYNPETNTKLQDTEVRVFQGKVDNTEYIFLDTPPNRFDPDTRETVTNAQIFNVQDKNPKSPNNGTAYANNIYGTDEITRMSFFSKAVYELMKDIKENKFQTLSAPNAILLNDWHAGPLAAMMHYTANAEADAGRISKETGKYFDETPTIYIAHNAEHQGATNGDDNKRTAVFATLFGGYGVDILNHAKSWDIAPKENSNALMRHSDFNSAMTGMSLSDRVVPVSEYYGEELTKSDIKANGLIHLMKARAYGKSHTLTPITNGYSKDLIAPTLGHMHKVFDGTVSDLSFPDYKIDLEGLKLLPYDSNHLENKLKNKETILKIFGKIIERERTLSDQGNFESRRYLLHDAHHTEIPKNIEDLTKVPLIVFSGRMDPQKGLDTILKDAMWKFAEEHKNTPDNALPIFIIGGKISQQSTYDELARMKDEMYKQYPNVAKRIVLVHDFVRTDLVATAADFFMVPSVFEPCGLTQLEAMAKGAVPIATSTGGLVNTIIDGKDGFRTKAFFDQQGWETKGRIYGEGFSTNGEAYCEAIDRALSVYYGNYNEFENIQKAGMQNDFSWDNPGGALDKYIRLIRTGRTA